ncbi:29247_t:CDS:2, partial [Racocetra persica]
SRMNRVRDSRHGDEISEKYVVSRMNRVRDSRHGDEMSEKYAVVMMTLKKKKKSNAIQWKSCTPEQIERNSILDHKINRMNRVRDSRHGDEISENTLS